jgi:hypothetical protein
MKQYYILYNRIKDIEINVSSEITDIIKVISSLCISCPNLSKNALITHTYKLIALLRFNLIFSFQSWIFSDLVFFKTQTAKRLIDGLLSISN